MTEDRETLPEWLKFDVSSSALNRFDGALGNSSETNGTEQLRRREARWRMVAAHAAIRRYQWEYDRLPASLADLKLPRFTTDPATNKPFHYEITRNGYVLSCPEFATAEGKPIPEKDRKPMNLLTEIIVEPVEKAE